MVGAIEELSHQLDKLKKENEKMSKGYAELTEIVSPYIDDFTGYNEKLDGFDIVLCVKELLQQLDKLKADNEQLKEELSVIQHNCNREGCKYYDDDTFKVFYKCKAQKALQLSANSVTTKYCDLLKALIEIKAICNNNDELQGDFNVVDCDKYKLGKHNLANKILQKISEVVE